MKSSFKPQVEKLEDRLVMDAAGADVLSHTVIPTAAIAGIDRLIVVTQLKVQAPSSDGNTVDANTSDSAGKTNNGVPLFDLTLDNSVPGGALRICLACKYKSSPSVNLGADMSLIGLDNPSGKPESWFNLGPAPINAPLLPVFGSIAALQRSGSILDFYRIDPANRPEAAAVDSLTAGDNTSKIGMLLPAVQKVRDAAQKFTPDRPTSVAVADADSGGRRTIFGGFLIGTAIGGAIGAQAADVDGLTAGEVRMFLPAVQKVRVNAALLTTNMTGMPPIVLKVRDIAPNSFAELSAGSTAVPLLPASGKPKEIVVVGSDAHPENGGGDADLRVRVGSEPTITVEKGRSKFSLREFS